MTKLVLALVIALVWHPGLGLAVAVDPPLADPTLEARAQIVFKSLRCLVCQNQSISDSDADLARDLRVIVRERIAAGDSDDQARAYLVDRYGDWVLLKPPVKTSTIALWVGPLIMFGIAGLVAVGFYRHRRVQPEGKSRPLDDDEQRRIEDLMGDANDV